MVIWAPALCAKGPQFSLQFQILQPCCYERPLQISSPYWASWNLGTRQFDLALLGANGMSITYAHGEALYVLWVI